MAYELPLVAFAARSGAVVFICELCDRRLTAAHRPLRIDNEQYVRIEREPRLGTCALQDCDARAEACAQCGDALAPRRVMTIDGVCWNERCRAAMPLAIGFVGTTLITPMHFTTADAAAAVVLGARLEQGRSKMMGGATYLANICPRCNAIYGDTFLGPECRHANTPGGTQVGQSCEKCFQDFLNPPD